MSTAALKIVEGGKSGKGRPKKEEIEALRKDTQDKLQALGVLEDVKAYAGKKGWGKPEVWNTQRCLKLLKYGRDIAQVPMCSCGKPAKHFGDKDDPFQLCDDCHATDEALGQTLADAVTADMAGGYKFTSSPAVSLYFRDSFILARESWVFPYYREVVLWEACLAARAEADRLRDLLEIARADKDAVLGPLLAITSDPMYRASLDDIIFVVTLDRGRAVRDFRNKCRTLMVDAFNRDEPKYKGKVKLIFKAAYDDLPSNNKGMPYTVEVKEDLPAFVSGSRMYHNKKGDLLKSGEVYGLTDLGKAGSEATA